MIRLIVLQSVVLVVQARSYAAPKHEHDRDHHPHHKHHQDRDHGHDYWLITLGTFSQGSIKSEAVCSCGYILGHELTDTPYEKFGFEV